MKGNEYMITVVVALENPTDNIKETLNSIYKKDSSVKTLVLYTFSKAYKDEAKEHIDEIKAVKSKVGNNITEYEIFDTPLFSAYQAILNNITTPYVQFLKAGDVYVNNSLSMAVDYLDSERTKADAAFLNRVRTKAKRNKFSNVTISLNNYHEHIPYEFHSVVFKTNAIKSVGFKTNIPHDAGFDALCRILVKKMSVCLVEKAVIITNEPVSSNTQNFRPCLYKEWYHESLENYMLALIDYMKNEVGMVPIFVQQILFYGLKLKFLHNENNNNHHVIDEDTDSFFILCKKVLNEIDDNVILNRYLVPYIKTSQILRNVFIKLKYQENYHIDYFTSHNAIYMVTQNQLLFNSLAQPVRIDVTEYKEDKLIINASIVGIFDFSVCDLKIIFDEENLVPFKEVYRFAHTKYFGISASKRYTFRFEISKNRLLDTRNGGSLKFYISYNGIETLCKISTDRYNSKISSKTTFSYWNFDEFTLGWKNEQELYIKKRSLLNSFIKETKFLARTLIEPEIGYKMFIIRLAYWCYYPFLHNKNIWITYDKLYKGGDCGEYLYKYANGRNKNIIVDYVINKDSDDRKRLKNEGYNPLIFGTLKQKMHYLFSSVVLNTHAGTHSFCSFANNSVHFVQGLIKSDAMCIQHGLTVQQLAFEENQAFNNTKRYYCASKYEIKNLSHPIYGYYDKECLKLTGIPRYDGLINNDQKQILITPTWRNYISMPSVMGQSRPYNPHFKETDYFKIYNSLIANKKLVKCAKNNGYKLIYLLHPVISSQLEDYTVQDGVEIVPATTVNYEKILTESSLMVTDYSGVQFDFAYMKKPVVYFHPPELPPHYKEGGFFYETMGFGEICKYTDELVDVLCSYIENNCASKEKYLERINDFYAFDDLNSCERIYNDVIEYQKSNNKFS